MSVPGASRPGGMRPSSFRRAGRRALFRSRRRANADGRTSRKTNEKPGREARPKLPGRAREGEAGARGRRPARPARTSGAGPGGATRRPRQHGGGASGASRPSSEPTRPVRARDGEARSGVRRTRRHAPHERGVDAVCVWPLLWWGSQRGKRDGRVLGSWISRTGGGVSGGGEARRSKIVAAAWSPSAALAIICARLYR